MKRKILRLLCSVLQGLILFLMGITAAVAIRVIYFNIGEPPAILSIGVALWGPFCFASMYVFWRIFSDNFWAQTKILFFFIVTYAILLTFLASILDPDRGLGFRQLATCIVILLPLVSLAVFRRRKKMTEKGESDGKSGL